MLTAKWPPTARLVLEKVSDGTTSGGFTWHRTRATDAAEGDEGGREVIGLRGTIFIELDPKSGQISYVREGAEPLFKAGAATEALLKAVTALASKPVRQPTYTPRSPTTASAIVDYLWREAYPNGADPTTALGLFADSIRYEDFNYEEAFEGIEQVTDFVTAFDIPGVEFVPIKISEGDRGCCFTWTVKVNGADGPSGISFYEVTNGKVSFIRDIPAPSLKPPPLATLAAVADPELRVFSPRRG